MLRSGNSVQMVGLMSIQLGKDLKNQLQLRLAQSCLEHWATRHWGDDRLGLN